MTSLARCFRAASAGPVGGIQMLNGCFRASRSTNWETAMAAQQPLTRWLGHYRTTASTIFNPQARGFYKKGFGFFVEGVKTPGQQKLSKNLT
jgi:hypothetical protein